MVQRNAEAALDYLAMTPKQLAKQLEQLEKQMITHAQNLEFEEAAAIRDQIKQIEEALFK